MESDYKYPCPNCAELLEFDFDPRGETFDCPTCGKSFTVPAKQYARKATKPKVDRTLHYILGLMLGPFGIMISAMVDKNGVSYAVRGFIVHLAICIGLILVASTAGYRLF